MRLPTDFDKTLFLAELDKSPELKGIRVVFISEGHTQVVREGPPYCTGNQKAIIIRRGIEQTALQVPQAAASRDGKVLNEVLGTGLSCGAAFLSWVVVAGSTGAAPITGGGSTFLTYLGIGAGVASTAQCFNGLGRVATEMYNPEALDIFDRQSWYQNTMLAVDAVSVLGAATAGAATLKLVLQLRASTGQSIQAILKGLSRQQRKSLAEDLIRSHNPSISNKKLKLLVSQGIYPKRIPRGHVPEELKRQLLDAAGAAMSFTGSAMSGVVRTSGALVFGYGEAINTF